MKNSSATASLILSNTCFSRARPAALPRISPAKLTPSAEIWMRSPPRSASVSTSRSSTNTFPIAMEVLSDLVLNPVFAVEDIVRERRVILEEIKMDEDSPEYLVHEIFTQNFWKDHPLGKPILGTKETVRAFEQPAVLDLYQKRFTPGNFIISAAGNLDHTRFVDLVVQHFDNMKPAKNGFHQSVPKIVPRITLRNKKSLEQ